MKRKFVLINIYVLIFIFLLSGCSESFNPSDLPNQTPYNSFSDAINLYNVAVFDSDWSNFLKKNYSIDIQTYGRKPDVEFTEILNELKTNEELNGFFYINVYDFFMLGDDVYKYFIPIDEYINGSYPWSTLNEHYRGYSELNGRTWGIPFVYDAAARYRISRVYNNSILSALNLTAPTTLNQLYEVLQKVKNSNRIDNTMLIPGKLSAFYGTWDIFWSNGALMDNSDHFNLVSIVFNTEKGTFEDIANTENVRESLYFLKSLYDSGIVVKKSVSAVQLVNLFSNNKLATLMEYEGGRMLDPEYLYMDISHSLLLNSNFSNQEIPVISYAGFYAVLKDTTNIDGKIDSIINTFFREDLYKGYSGEAIYLFDYPYSSKPMKGYAEHVEREHKLYESFINNNSMRHYSITNYIKSFRPDTYNDKIINLFEKSFSNIFNENTSIEDIYITYNDTMQKLNYMSYISSLNDAIGKY